MSSLDLLVEMGFPRNRAEKAVAMTGGRGLQPAMDWLLAHQDDPDIDDPPAPGQGGQKLGAPGSDGGGAEEGATPTPQQAKSLKCDDCGKLFHSDRDVQAHAGRTKHTNFSESTEEIRPLTEEEKKAQLAKLEERRKQRKAEREEQERKDKIDREKMRRKTGKEISDIKHRMELQEAKKLAEERRREKMEDRAARQKVKDQIARDKAERAAKASPQAQASSQSPTASSQAVGTPKKDYDSCRLQVKIRLMGGGRPLVHTFQSSDTLIEVQRFILMNQPGDNQPFTLMTNFPKRTFTADDMGRTLQELGLVPSAVLIQTRPT